MEMLNIRLMGSMSLRLGDRELGEFATRKSKALFAFLVLHRGRVLSREAIAAEFWGDLPEVRGRKALNTDFWRVRCFLDEAGIEPGHYLHSGSDGIGFREQSLHWVDVAQIERAVAHAVRIPAEHADDATIQALDSAIELYRGDLLQDLHDDWCLLHRETLRARYLTALDFLMRARMARLEWPAALDIGQRLIAVDSLQEHVHRALMRCFNAMGNRPAAIRQYRACAAMLLQELAVEPMPETQSLYQLICGVAQSGKQTLSQPPSMGGKLTLQEVDLALASVNMARNLLIDISDQLQSATGRKPG